MSCPIGDENTDSIMSIENHLDSGYLTLSSSPCRLSPSSVILRQANSPDLQSPASLSQRSFLSTIDYEHYISTRKHFDILTQLHHRHTYHLIDTILANLSMNDLASCLHVCRNWHFILKDYSRRKQTKNVKRNLFHSHKKPPVTKNKFTSTPMQTITNLLDLNTLIPIIIEPSPDENSLPSTPSQQCRSPLHLAASTMTFRYGYLKYLHGPTIPKRCPICAYVSIVDVNDQHGICTNPLCRNSFCHCCSGPYHPSSPCKPTTGPIKSPCRQRSAISPIYSNKTRNNLRRLLLR